MNKKDRVQLHRLRMMNKHSHNHDDYVPPEYRYRLPDELRNVIHDVEQVNTMTVEEGIDLEQHIKGIDNLRESFVKALLEAQEQTTAGQGDYRGVGLVYRYYRNYII